MAITGREARRGAAASHRPELHAGAEEFLRIDGVAVDAGLVVQMRAGRAAGGADLADHLAGPHALADGDVDRREMAVAGDETVTVVDLDHLAIAALPTRDRDLAVSSDAHRVADRRLQIEAGMHGGRLDERVHAHAEARGRIEVAGERLAHRHAAER